MLRLSAIYDVIASGGDDDLQRVFLVRALQRQRRAFADRHPVVEGEVSFARAFVHIAVRQSGDQVFGKQAGNARLRRMFPVGPRGCRVRRRRPGAGKRGDGDALFVVVAVSVPWGCEVSNRADLPWVRFSRKSPMELGWY